MKKRFNPDRFDPRSTGYEEPMVLFTHPKPGAHVKPAPKREPTERQRKQAKWIVLGAGALVATTVIAGIAGTSHDSSGSSSTTTTSVYDELNAQMQERIRNAGYDSYFRMLAKQFGLPRSEMHRALAVAPMVCYYNLEMDDPDTARSYVYDIVLDYPSTYSQDIRSGREPNVPQYTSSELVDFDADTFVLTTTLDYCTALGY
ncbi:hypothetical protein [Rhodococcus pyridinivorans]